MRALLIANAVDSDPGFVGDRLRHHGFTFSECHREHPSDWPSLDGHDLVVMLGSEWSVYWPQVSASVQAESELLRAADRLGVPQLGICFGNQVMAHAFGGTVQRGRMPEIGWHSVSSDDPVHLAEGPWLQWHYDVVTLPVGAVELARSPIGPQAWTLRRNLATQFHPEATETMLARWSQGAGATELEAVGSSSAALMGSTREHAVLAQEHADVLVDWFLDDIAQRPTDQPRADR